LQTCAEIPERPAGAINASAKDMAAYVQFYLNRGAAGETQILPASSIDRMENPTRTWAAQQGLKGGYGLSNYTSIHDGFVYHGHNGGVDGGITELSYMPEYNVGYFYSINSAKGDAFGKIGDAIRAYITRNLTKPAVPAAAQLPANAQEYAGWYEPDSPRNQFSYFIEHLAAIHRVTYADGKLMLSGLGALNQPFVPVTGTKFRSVPKKGSADPIATLMLVAPNAEGRFLQVAGGMYTMKRIPACLAIAEIALVAWFLLAFVSILLYAPFWIFGGLIKRRRRPAERMMRLWPLIAVLSLLAFVGLVILSGSDAIARLGNLTFYSFGLTITTLLFAASSLAGAVTLWRARKQEIRRSVRSYSITVTAALLIAVVYLAYFGIIGIRTWS
jgi:hypothetical protein